MYSISIGTVSVFVNVPDRIRLSDSDCEKVSSRIRNELQNIFDESELQGIVAVSGSSYERGCLIVAVQIVAFMVVGTGCVATFMVKYPTIREETTKLAKKLNGFKQHINSSENKRQTSVVSRTDLKTIEEIEELLVKLSGDDK